LLFKRFRALALFHQAQAALIFIAFSELARMQRNGATAGLRHLG
jgi:hypothetical protein